MRSNANIRGALRTSDADTPFAVCVTTASESAARDLAAIHAGTPGFTLMLRAGTRATEVVVRDYGRELAHGVVVFAGSGNNGGDAYIVAAQLVRLGVRVVVVAAKPPRTPDAMRATALLAATAQGANVRCAIITVDEALALEAHAPTAPDTCTRNGDHTDVTAHARTTLVRARIIVDGLLGTGHRGALRDTVAQCATRIAAYRERGATIVALDVPSGLDASTGARAIDGVNAHVTVTFGTIKRGLLIDRAATGRLVVVDIGLRVHGQLSDGAWRYATHGDLSAMLPTTDWNAYKGDRGQLALVGGASGMAGAIMLAARAALHSGIGLTRAFVDGPGVPAVQCGVPQTMASAWDTTVSAGEATTRTSNDRPWGTALALGPGLGRQARSHEVLDAALQRYRGLPMVIDADALTLLATRPTLDHFGDGGDVVFTPHAGEFARLTGAPTPVAWQERAAAAVAFAQRTNTTVLLKGTPTLVATPDGAPPTVVARGNAALATGGSGDMLTGIIGALLAQGVRGSHAAVLGAHVHGMAAEHASVQWRSVRGVTLDDVLGSMTHVWRDIAHSVSGVRNSLGVIEDLPLAQGIL